MEEALLLMVYVIFIIIIFLILLRSYLKKQKIKKDSFYYNKIVYLNNNYQLEYFIKQLRFHKKYKSKSAVDKSNLSDAALQYVSENLTYIEDLMLEYNKAEQQYVNYKKLVNKILETEFDYSVLRINKILFFSLTNYIDLEKKMLSNIIYKNKNELSLYVYVDYISPKGRNHWYKEHKYLFDSIVNFVKTAKQHEEYMKSVKYQRSILSDSLRYDVLKRDEFACQICGASYKNDGVKLEVDHVIPVSKGGKTELENLQTLCERCNRGKSNKY